MSWSPSPAKLLIAMTITIYLKPAIEGAELPPAARNPTASQHRQRIYHNACATANSLLVKWSRCLCLKRWRTERDTRGPREQGLFFKPPIQKFSTFGGKDMAHRAHTITIVITTCPTGLRMVAGLFSLLVCLFGGGSGG